MTVHLNRRKGIMKRLLQRRLVAIKEALASAEGDLPKLPALTARAFAEILRAEAPGISFSNVARDIRTLCQPGENYDAEFDILWRGQTCWQIIKRYDEKFLCHLIRAAFGPTDIDARLAAATAQLPGNRRAWETF